MNIRRLHFGVGIIATVATISTSVFAQDSCDAPLRDGVFNSLKVNKSSYSSMVLAWQFSQMTTSEAKEKIQAGVTVPIKGFPVSGSFDDETFKSWQQSVKEALQSALFGNDVEPGALT